MTIWLLTLVLLGALAAVGYSQGAIRVAFSLVGIVLGALLALPLAHFVKPILAPLGVVNPLLIWALAPFIVFVVIQVLFKVGGLAVHKKVEVYYKYKAGDLRLSLWERLNRRLGACLGLMNGAAYLVLIALVIYPFSYLTVQMSGGPADSKLVKILDQAGRDVVSTGLAKAVCAVDPVPEPFYQVSDIVGLLYNDVRVQGRLSRYPLFMHLEEEPPFSAFGADPSFTEMFMRTESKSMGTVLANANIKAVLDDPQMLQRLWDLVLPNIADLRTYLETGKSPTFDPEKILDRWSFDAHSAVLALKRSDPDLTTAQMRLLRRFLYPVLEKARFVAYPDNKAVLKGFVRFNWATKPPPVAVAPAVVQPLPARGAPAGRYGAPGGRYGMRGPSPAPAPVPVAPMAPIAGAAPAVAPVSEPRDLNGTWQNVGGKYRLSFPDGGKTLAFDAVVEGDRLTLTGEREPLVFERD